MPKHFSSGIQRDRRTSQFVLRVVLGVEALARLQHGDAIALLGEAERRDAAPEPEPTTR